MIIHTSEVNYNNITMTCIKSMHRINVYIYRPKTDVRILYTWASHIICLAGTLEVCLQTAHHETFGIPVNCYKLFDDLIQIFTIVANEKSIQV